MFNEFIKILIQDAGRGAALMLADTPSASGNGRGNALLDLTLVKTSVRTAIKPCIQAVMGKHARLQMPCERSHRYFDDFDDFDAPLPLDRSALIDAPLPLERSAHIAARVREMHAGLLPVDGELRLAVSLFSFALQYDYGYQIYEDPSGYDEWMERQQAFVEEYLDSSSRSSSSRRPWTHLDVFLTADNDEKPGLIVLPCGALKSLLAGVGESLRSLYLDMDARSSRIDDDLAEPTARNGPAFGELLSSVQLPLLQELDVDSLPYSSLADLGQQLSSLHVLRKLTVTLVQRSNVFGYRSLRTLLKDAPASLVELDVSPVVIHHPPDAQGSDDDDDDEESVDWIEDTWFKPSIRRFSTTRFDPYAWAMENRGISAPGLAAMFPEARHLDLGHAWLAVLVHKQVGKWRPFLSELSELGSDIAEPITFQVFNVGVWMNQPVALRMAEMKLAKDAFDGCAFRAVRSAKVDIQLRHHSVPTQDWESEACALLSAIVKALPCLAVLSLNIRGWACQEAKLTDLAGLLGAACASLPDCTTEIRLCVLYLMRKPSAAEVAQLGSRELCGEAGRRLSPTSSLKCIRVAVADARCDADDATYIDHYIEV